MKKLKLRHKKTEINFRSVVGKSSRAAEATTENLESQGFILYAYNTKTITMDKVTAGSLTTTFINGKKQLVLTLTGP